MESNGIGGSVCISEATHSLIMKSDIIKENLEFDLVREIQIDVIGKKINSYKVEQKLDEDAESSEEYSDDGQEQVSHRSSNTAYGEERDNNSDSDEEDSSSGKSDLSEDMQQRVYEE